MTTQTMQPILPLWGADGAQATEGTSQRQQATLFSDIFQAAVDNVRQADAVKNDEKMDCMVSLLRTFCETGGNLVQFNFASNAVLRAAQKDPDQYRDLLVRVATYSAFFVELGPETQEDIINRNELE